MTTASTPPSRYVQILHLAAGLVSAMVQIAYFVIKTTYQRLRPQPAKSLQGQIVMVTGAGHGIGRQLSLEFGRHGCTVICVDADEIANNLTAHDINTRHHQKLEVMGEVTKEKNLAAQAYACDVTDRNQVAELANRIQQDVGYVDILVNNVGTVPVQSMFEVQPADVIDIVNVNLLSHFWTVLAFLPSMVKRNHGHIVAISTVDDLCGLDKKVPYSASKCAVAGLMDALSQELHLDSHNIKLTCAYPYFVDTRPDLPEQLRLRIPELSPEHAASEIVNAVRHNVDTITVPRNLLFWHNVLRTLPQDARDIWSDLFHTRVVPPGLSNTTISQVQGEGIKT